MANATILAQKSALVEELAQKIKDASGAVLVDYTGVTVEVDTKLRNEFRSAGVEYKVYKNSILTRAFEKAGVKGFENLVGVNALALCKDDPTAPARIAVDYSTKSPLKAKCGMIDGEFADEAKVLQLAKIPAKPQLVAQLLGMLTNPMRSLAVALSEIAKKSAA